MARADGNNTVATYNPFVGNHMRPREAPQNPVSSLVAAVSGEKAVTLRWSDDHESTFHHIWLRYNCFCKNCGTSDDGIRHFDLTAIPNDIRPTHSEVDGQGNLIVVWNDGAHKSEYGSDWLRSHCYSDSERRRRRSFKPTLWKSDLIDSLPKVDYQSIQKNEGARLQAFEYLRDFGFLVVSDVGINPDETERAAALFGPIHPTSNYGVIAEVQSVKVPKIGGYTAIHQNPHCDDTFQYVPPGIVLFHCIVNDDNNGGISSYTDGFAVAEDLRTEQPEAFELLSRVPVQFVRRHPGQFFIQGEGRVICLDDAGNLSGIRYFDRAAAPLDVAFELVEKMFWAQREFLKRVIDPAFMMQMKLQPGEMIVVDNHRVMHGRSEFDQRSNRWIRTCMTDREETHGYWRDLAYRLGRDDYDMVLPSGALIG